MPRRPALPPTPPPRGWKVTRQPENDFGTTQVYGARRASGPDDHPSAQVWVDTAGNARCTGCAGPLEAMLSSCGHARAVRRVLQRAGRTTAPVTPVRKATKTAPPTKAARVTLGRRAWTALEGPQGNSFFSDMLRTASDQEVATFLRDALPHAERVVRAMRRLIRAHERAAIAAAFGTIGATVTFPSTRRTP